jgi:hypothetical protein
LVIGERHGKEQEGESADDEKKADNCTARLERSQVSGTVHTIKLPEVVRDILAEGSSALFLGQNSPLQGSVLIAPENIEDWNSNHRGDDGEGAIAPVPATCLEEGLSSAGTNEGGDNVGGGRKGENQSSVLQGGGISHEDIKDISHAIESNPVEDLSCSERLNV